MGTARNLLDGHGFTAPPGSPPLSHFPPLFPLLLAAIGWVTGLDPLDVAGIVNPLLLGATALLVAVVVRRRSGSVGLGVAASAAVVVAVDLLVYFASALTEPLFVVLVLGAMVSLAAAVDRGGRWPWVVAVACTAGACLTRYVGVALVVAEVGVLLATGGGGRQAWRRAAAVGGASVVPLVVWLAAAGSGNRPVVVHLFDADYWVSGARSLSRWVLPPYVSWPVRGVATAVVVGALTWSAVAGRAPVAAAGRRQDRPPDVFGLLLPAFAVTYLAVLVVDRVLLDATGRLDLRFLAVLHVVAVVGLLPWLHRHLTGRARPAAAAAGLVLLALHGVQAASWVADGLTDTSVGRRGLTAAAWEDSPVLAAVAALPPDVTVYSNAPEAVFLLTGRAASPLPAHTDYLSDRRRPEYEAERAALADRLAARPGGGGVAAALRLPPAAPGAGRRARRGAGGGGRRGHPVPPSSLSYAVAIAPDVRATALHRTRPGRRAGRRGPRSTRPSPLPVLRAPRCPGPPPHPATPPPGRAPVDRLDRARPGVALLPVAGQHQGDVGQAVDEPVPSPGVARSARGVGAEGGAGHDRAAVDGPPGVGPAQAADQRVGQDPHHRDASSGRTAGNSPVTSGSPRTAARPAIAAAAGSQSPTTPTRRARPTSSTAPAACSTGGALGPRRSTSRRG